MSGNPDPVNRPWSEPSNFDPISEPEFDFLADPLREARGIMLGLAIGSAMWAGVGIIVWRALR